MEEADSEGWLKVQVHTKDGAGWGGVSGRGRTHKREGWHRVHMHAKGRAGSGTRAGECPVGMWLRRHPIMGNQRLDHVIT
jgi:hypothetical protein